MLIEIFTQQGFTTVLEQSANGYNSVTFDYTGSAIRELGSTYKRMVSTSGTSVDIAKSIKSISQINGDILIKDTDSLRILSNPIINKRVWDLFREACEAVRGAGVDINFAYTEKNAIIQVDRNSTEKKEEHFFFTVWDRHDPINSQYVLRTDCDNLNKTIPDLKKLRDWIHIKRKLKTRLNGGKHKVLFAKGIGGIFLHEIYGHHLEMNDQVGKSLSLAKKLLNTQHSDKLTLIDGDFALAAEQVHDDEGTKKREVVLIDKGRIINKLTDKRALIDNLGLELTGNARRESYLHYPSPRMCRTFVQNGKSLPDQAISEIDYGFFAEEISYASYSRVNGDVVCCVSKGRIIRNGKITDIPVTFFISHNALTPLKILHTCNDLKFLPGGCSSISGRLYVELGSPTMSFDELEVSGVFSY